MRPRAAKRTTLNRRGGAAGITGALEPDYAAKTWRYLRLAMVGLVIGLGAAIAYERSKVHPGCFQTSISAYYYTPVRGYFVGALIGIGVCLVCLRGNTPIEDVLLNLAGMFAPLVALVPTPNPGSCSSFPISTQGRDVNVANNVTALLVVGFLGLVVAAILIARSGPARHVVIAYGAALVVFVTAALVFSLARHFFTRSAHYTAAILMFLCILAVVCSNALGYRDRTQAESVRNRYTVIAAAMVISSLVIIVAGLLGWRYWLIAIETSLITLFAVFWAIQTRELWNEGLRPAET